MEAGRDQRGVSPRARRHAPRSGVVGSILVVVLVLVAGVAACTGQGPDPAGAREGSGGTTVLVDDEPVGSPDTSTSTAVPSRRELVVVGPAERVRRLSVAVSGDVLIHEAVWQSAAAHAEGEGYDFTPVFAAIEPVLADADLALCHLEVPLSADNTDLSTYPRFTAPHQLADALAGAGYDGCSVASNHVLDRGTPGIDATLGHLDRVGVGHAGAARTPEEAATIRRYDVRGVSIAHLSYTYGYNGLRPPTGEDWRSNLLAVEAIAADTARARAEGADLVLVSLHWGDEYVHTPNRQQRDLAAALDATADIDLVVGHHAHVVQPVAQVGTTPVVYGLGNLLSNMRQPERRDGVVLIATFEAAPGRAFGLTGIHALPTWVELPGHRVVPAPPESALRTLGHLGAEGVAVPPLGVAGVTQ